VSDRGDIVTLRIPRSSRELPVMRVVMGGMASRLDVPLDRLDDVELAVETLLAEEPVDGHELLLELAAVEGGLDVRLYGLLNRRVRAALVATDPFEPCEGCLLDVRVMLESLVDAFSVVESSGGSYGVLMEKRTS